jgi:hypothetical protein
MEISEDQCSNFLPPNRFSISRNPRVFAKATGFSRRRRVVCAPSRATGELAVWAMAMLYDVRGGNGHEKARRGTKKSSCDFSCLLVAAFCWSLFPRVRHPRFYQIVDGCKVPIFGQGEEFTTEDTEKKRGTLIDANLR